MAIPFKAFQEGIDAIGKFLGEILSYLNPFSENFFVYRLIELLGNLFSDLFSNIETILSYINPFSENFILKGVLDFFAEIISYLNPFSENFFVYKLIELLGNLLKWLFVPTENSFEQLQNKVNDKFYFVHQIGDMFSSLLGNVNYGENPPTFSITYYRTNTQYNRFYLIYGLPYLVAWHYFVNFLVFIHKTII